MVDKSSVWTLSLTTSNARQQSLKGEAARRTNQSPAQGCLGVEAGRAPIGGDKKGGGALGGWKGPGHTSGASEEAVFAGLLASRGQGPKSHKAFK